MRVRFQDARFLMRADRRKRIAGCDAVSRGDCGGVRGSRRVGYDPGGASDAGTLRLIGGGWRRF